MTLEITTVWRLCTDFEGDHLQPLRQSLQICLSMQARCRRQLLLARQCTQLSKGRPPSPRCLPDCCCSDRGHADRHRISCSTMAFNVWSWMLAIFSNPLSSMMSDCPGTLALPKRCPCHPSLYESTRRAPYQSPCGRMQCAVVLIRRYPSLRGR